MFIESLSPFKFVLPFLYNGIDYIITKAASLFYIEEKSLTLKTVSMI
ncbi:hypothetical protein HMPREF0080_01050 [Anaeroglobus geminatus F0357]|uniref:Uncharacterized protein n=1 Tax=Anaeroglobus geminatus F0357 TaxID=861450 RepID=G9YHC2_9FIRM|nr:hypothetical protein HMPREF0080_01050 [Anaeroglobus geminatus F0357]